MSSDDPDFDLKFMAAMGLPTSFSGVRPQQQQQGGGSKRKRDEVEASKNAPIPTPKVHQSDDNVSASAKVSSMDAGVTSTSEMNSNSKSSSTAPSSNSTGDALTSLLGSYGSDSEAEESDASDFGPQPAPRPAANVSTTSSSSSTPCSPTTSSSKITTPLTTSTNDAKKDVIDDNSDDSDGSFGPHPPRPSSPLSSNSSSSSSPSSSSSSPSSSSSSSSSSTSSITAPRTLAMAAGDIDDEGDYSESEDETKRSRRPTKGKIADEEEGDNDEDNDFDDDDDAAANPPRPSLSSFRVPVAYEASMKGGDRANTALAVDPSGARAAVGSVDEIVRLYDFGGMNERMLHFRSFHAAEGYPVKHVRFNPKGTLLLVITGSSQPLIYDREGKYQQTFPKGYPYIMDLDKTIGHKAPCTGGVWHPVQENYCLTSNEDGSLRQWDINTASKSSVDVIKVKPQPGRRACVTACAYGDRGNYIAAGSRDGAVHVWQSGKGAKYLFTDVTIAKAHDAECDITAVSFKPDDDKVLVTRATDHTMKVWDLRKAKEPLAVFADLENGYDGTDVAWSPDGALLVTGTSNKSVKRKPATAAAGGGGGEGEGEGKDEGAKEREGGDSVNRKGMLAFVETKTWTHVQSLAMSDSSVVRVAWHPAIKQIFAACSDGTTKVLYDPANGSERGALLAVARKAKAKDVSDFVSYDGGEVVVFGGENDPKKLRKAKRDLRNAMVPAKPAGKDTRGYNATSVLHQHLKDMVGKTQLIANTDPREALFKYADGPKIYTSAYDKTQPAPVFQEDVNEIEVDLKAKKIVKK